MEPRAEVGEAEHCDNLSALARRHDIRTSQLYTWRRELRYARAARQASDGGREREAMFVPVVADRPLPMSPEGAIEVEVGGAVVRIGRTASAELATAVLQALRVSP